MKLADLPDKYPKMFGTDDPPEALAQYGWECGEGWCWLLDRLFGCIQERIDEGTGADQFEVWCIKEKWGHLTIYGRGDDQICTGMLWLAEHLSESICEDCGSFDGKLREGGYVHVSCDECEGGR